MHFEWRAEDERQRRFVLQPRVARHELPWEPVQSSDQPQRGCVRALAPGDATPLGLETCFFRNPRVGAPASRQPWAGGWNAVGVQEGDAEGAELCRYAERWNAIGVQAGY